MKSSILRNFSPFVVALLVAIVTLTAPAVSNAGVYLSVTIAPPLLPVYEQPLIPGPGYVWTPGYWAWDSDDGYYWVPGTWVPAPFVGALWTPGYWAWEEGLYFWRPGYWGFHVGFYGGVCYGFGYTGHGYQGGYWEDGSLRYNRAVNNVNVTNITNTYNTTVVNNTSVTRVSYNGGSGGVIARPTPQERSAARERHTPLLPVQAQHELAANSNRALFASANHGRPDIAATARPERIAAGPKPVRSFSQQAAVRPVPVPPRSNPVNPTPKAGYGERPERRNAPTNSGSAQWQAAPRAPAPVPAPSERRWQEPPQARVQREASPQAPVRPQGSPQRYPQEPARMQRESAPQAPVRPQGPPQMQMRALPPAHPATPTQPQAFPPQPGRPPHDTRGPRGGPDDRPGER